MIFDVRTVTDTESGVLGSPPRLGSRSVRARRARSALGTHPYSLVCPTSAPSRGSRRPAYVAARLGGRWASLSLVAVLSVGGIGRGGWTLAGLMSGKVLVRFSW